VVGEFCARAGVEESWLREACGAFVSFFAAADRPQNAALSGLDSGEREAIQLALPIRADLLLVDDGEAGAIATRLRVAIVGTLRSLAQAKRLGIVELVPPLFTELRTKLDFRISRTVEAKIHVVAGE